MKSPRQLKSDAEENKKIALPTSTLFLIRQHGSLPTRKSTLVPIVLASLGVALVTAYEASFQMELNKPVACPEGLACDRVVFRDMALFLAGMIFVVAGGVVFVAGRVVRPAKLAPSPEG
jgi:hypothetical protein